MTIRNYEVKFKLSYASKVKIISFLRIVMEYEGDNDINPSQSL